MYFKLYLTDLVREQKSKYNTKGGSVKPFDTYSLYI